MRILEARFKICDRQMDRQNRKQHDPDLSTQWHNKGHDAVKMQSSYDSCVPDEVNEAE